MTDSPSIAAAAIDTAEDAQAVATTASPDTSQPATSDQAPTAPRRRRHEVARKLEDWSPDDNVTMLLREVEFFHPFMCRNYNRIGIRSQLTLFMLQRVLPTNPQMLEAADTLSREFERRVGEFEKQIEVDSQNLLTTARASGIRTLPDRMATKPVQVKVPIYSPGMGRILGLFCKVDLLLSHVDYLFLNSLIPTGDQQLYIDKYRKLLWAEVQFLQKAWLHARRALREVQGAQRIDGDADQGDSAAEAKLEAA